MIDSVKDVTDALFDLEFTETCWYVPLTRKMQASTWLILDACIMRPTGLQYGRQCYCGNTFCA